MGPRSLCLNAIGWLQKTVPILARPCDMTHLPCFYEISFCFVLLRFCLLSARPSRRETFFNGLARTEGGKMPTNRNIGHFFHNIQFVFAAVDLEMHANFPGDAL